MTSKPKRAELTPAQLELWRELFDTDCSTTARAKQLVDEGLLPKWAALEALGVSDQSWKRRLDDAEVWRSQQEGTR